MAKVEQLKADLLAYTAFIQESLDRRVAREIGDTVVEAMLDLIEKGISPIEGNGRFPEYKWAAFRNAAKRGRLTVGRRKMNRRQLLAAARDAERRYPFTAFAISKGKKPRPVNLYLTGKFLRALTAKVQGAAGSVGISIEFRDKLSEKKESGHREGVFGQPERPIIPINTEDFAQSIQLLIYEIIEREIDRAAARAS